jgi:adenylate cyclase
VSEDGVERKLAAILAADVVGYSRLMGEDEAGTLARLKSLRKELVQPKITGGHGRIVKLMGDGLLAEFPSVVEAVRCAVAIQQELAGREADIPDERRLKLRIGVNLGDIIGEGSDIYGDGVNVAARLESLAQPGGICISGKVYEEVGNKLPTAFEDLGEQHVKNIPELVRMYRWTGTSAAPTPAMAEAMGALPLPDKPSIVVLPFDDMSDDAGDLFFADGITEDIITELSRFSSLFVIARNSAFTYKGRAVKPQEVRRDLGVRYIIEGSVRRSGDRVRVTVQLIDSETGSHVWADRYDREFGDIFDLHDELTQAIVATLPGRLLLAEEKRIRRKPPQQMAAYDYVLAGRIHHHRVTGEDNAEALRMLESAIQLDPNFAEAYAWKACTLGQALQFGFCADFAETEKEAFAAIDKALSLDENDVECHRLLCEVRMESRRLDQAKTHNELALAMNPNDPRIVAQRGELLTWLGRPEEGVAWIERAMRADPFGASGRAHLLGLTFYTARRYAEAIDAYKKIVSPNYMNLAEAAACHARIDDQAGATELATAALRLNPDFTVDQYMRTRTYHDPVDAEHLAEGLRAAGLPA